MSEWVRCTGCQLQHTRRPDGRCPRCGVPTGAPAPDAGEPLATVLVEPSGDRAAAIAVPAPFGAPARQAPRVWTVFTAVLLSQVAILIVGMAGGMVAGFVYGVRRRAPPSPAAIQRMLTEPATFLTILGLGALAAAALPLVAARLGREPVRSRLGLERPHRAGRAAALACAAALGVALMFDAITSALRVRPSGASEMIVRAISAGAGPGGHALAVFTLGLVVVAVLAPIGEELLYRGYMQRRLVQRWGPAAGILVSAGLFGLVHFDRLQSPFALVLGLLLGWIAVQVGSILPAVLGHATVNAWAVMASRLHWEPRSPAACAVVGALGLILVIAGVAGMRAGGGAPAPAATGAAPSGLSRDPLTPA